jgi:ATP-dependent helicase/nuclease subunit A
VTTYPPLPDAAARQKITERTDLTLFVEAGAGSGKTRSLVDRICRLVLHDGVELRHVAAVTFTEKAGAELRDRLRAELEKHTTGDQAHRADAALEDLDGAAIGTLHSFAQRILGEHPIEAGLPPLLEVADELSSSVAFEERWAGMQQDLLDDDDIAETLLLGMAAGVELKHLRALAKLLNSDWDLVQERILPDNRPVSTALRGLDELMAQADALATRADECTDLDDKFLPSLPALAAWIPTLRDALDAGQQLEALRHAADLKFPGNRGSGPSWGGALDEIRTGCKQWQEDVAQVVRDVVDAALTVLARWLAHRVVDAARARAAEGRLEFHDLLVLSRELLRTRADVRESLQQRYRHLLLDEFQDTDPIQIELAVRIAGGRAAEQERWEDVVVPPGSLFVVGDPKQSIYRFRRADIAMYLRAQQVFGGAGEPVSLTANFRTVEPIVDWVNDVFGRLIQFEEHQQPAYTPLDPRRRPAEGSPAVVVLGVEPHGGGRVPADDLRTWEAADVAGIVRRAVDEAWRVRDGEAWRPAELDDIAILVPARTSLPFLETALDAAGIPYRAEASSLVYEAQEVRDLLAAARAIADPSDALSLVAALRSPLFGCGDDDLWTWKRDGGAFSVIAPPDAERAEHPVARALVYLRGLHYDARWMAPSEVLTRLVIDRRMLELAAAGPRTRDAWRRLRFVVDQARAWSESEHGGLRAYLAWAHLQGAETSRVVEAALPETDARSVRIMTVHAAKGLEFPIVVMSGMTTAQKNQSGVRLRFLPDGSWAVAVRKGVTTGDFETAAALDEQMDEKERLRLLYVAATRARDHLVVSLHRGTSAKDRTSAALLAREGQAAAGAVEAWTVDPDDTPVPLVSPADAGVSPRDWAAWAAELEQVRMASRVPSAFSASGLEGTEPEVASEAGLPGGSAKGGVDVELPPWSKGRYGTAIGRAVHGVLQSIDLATGAGLDDTVAAQCVAEGVEVHADVVTALVRSALASEPVQRAAVRQYWREMYVGTLQDDGTVLEGFVDLVYREDDGSLVIVDYKTDAIPAEAVAARTQYYAPQIRAYVHGITSATGHDAAPVLIFLNPEAAVVAT